MPVPRWTTLSIVLFGLTLASAVVPAQTTIPPAHGTTLAGGPVALPDALNGKVGILVLGFSHASQNQVTPWAKLLQADYGQSEDVVYFAMPMLGGAPKMLRGMIEKSMSRAIPFEERPHFLPVTSGEPAWRAVAHYDKPDDAYVLLVDATGTVRWHTEGDATDASYAELKKNLRALTAKLFVP